MGQLFEEKGVLFSATDIHYLTVDEIFDFTEGATVTRELESLVDLRKAEYERFSSQRLRSRFITEGIPYLNDLREPTASSTDDSDDSVAYGVGCVSGIAEGKAAVVHDPHQGEFEAGQILIAESTDPGWYFLMIRAIAMVVERGSPLSHSAILARELGIPTVVGVSGATERIVSGAHVIVNGTSGEVQWH
jgi:pyruvate,water dikinase